MDWSRFHGRQLGARRLLRSSRQLGRYPSVSISAAFRERVWRQKPVLLRGYRVLHILAPNPVEMSGCPEGFGDELRVFRGENDRDKLLIVRSSFVEFLRDDIPLPLAAQTASRFFIALETPKICFGTNNQDEIGVGDVVVHPRSPSSREWVVLVEFAIDALASQPIGKIKYSIPVFGRIMRVTDHF